MLTLTNDLSKSFSLLSEYLAQQLLHGLSNFRMSEDVGHLLHRQASTPFSVILMPPLKNSSRIQRSRGRFCSQVRQLVVPLHCSGGTAVTRFSVTSVDCSRTSPFAYRRDTRRSCTACFMLSHLRYSLPTTAAREMDSLGPRPALLAS